MIYISYIFEWMVFEFLAQSIYHNLINNNECMLVTNNDSNNIKWNDGDILIVIPQFCWKFITLKLKEKQIKIIIINTEPIHMVDHISIYNYISTFSQIPITILDYSQKNINFFNIHNTNKNLEIIYLPYTYNKYIANLLPNDNTEKNIDILFCGWINSDRRNNIINKFREKGYKTEIQFTPYENIISQHSIMKRSKIIINIYKDSTNKIFDFYRFTPLICNNYFFISEHYENDNNDKLIEDSYKYILTSPYDDFVNYVSNIISTWNIDMIITHSKICNEWYKNATNYDLDLSNIIIKY